MLGLSLLNQAQPRSLRSKTTIIPTKGFEKKEDARREPGCPAMAQQHKKACGFRKEINQMWHGLQTPKEAFFNRNPKLLGLGRQFEQIHFGAFELFSANFSAPILVHWTIQVGFIDTFSYSLSFTSSILEQGLQSNHHLQMTSSEGFQQHFNIISKSVCCGFYMKKNIAFTLISFAVLK